MKRVKRFVTLELVIRGDVVHRQFVACGAKPQLEPFSEILTGMVSS